MDKYYIFFYYAKSRIDGAVEGKLKYSYYFGTTSSAIHNLKLGLLLGILLLFTEASAFAVAFVAAPFVEALKVLAWGYRKKKQPSAEDGEKRRKTITWKRLIIGLVVVLVALWALGTFTIYKYEKDFQKALEAYNSQDHETALEKFRELHQQRPREHGALFNLALCYYNLGRYEKAKRLFKLYVKQHGEEERVQEARDMLEKCRLQLEGESE